MEDLELLQGTVAAVVYQNAENGYAVLRLNCAGQAVSVVGTIPLPVPGERLRRQFPQIQVKVSEHHTDCIKFC